MIQELFNEFLTLYDKYCGNGKLLVISLAALLFLLLIKGKSSYSFLLLILSPISAVSAAFGKLMTLMKGRLRILFTVFLCGFIVLLSGERIYSADHLTAAENSMHIPGDCIEVMDYLLARTDNPVVLAMPDQCMYYTMYSSKFNMLYENQSDDDIRYLSEDARNAFNELSVSDPDMKIVSDAAVNYGCDYIVLHADHYWPMFPLDSYDYELIDTVSDWEIYARKGDD